MAWKTDSLEKLFNPEAIAVIGASDKPNRLGNLSLMALQEFTGEVFPVNPRLKEVRGFTCYPSVTSIDTQIDLALICLRGPSIPSVLRECSEVGIPSAIVFAAGYKELGEKGKKAQEEIESIANDSHIAVIGPNCLGAGNVNINLNATFFPHPSPPKKGSVAIISQSGGVCGSMLYSAIDADVGISKFVSVGNRVNIEFHDLLSYFKTDKDTKVVCCFVEGTESGRDMYEKMSEVTKKKPVMVFKVGKTPVARKAAYSHTGSLAGRAEIYSGAVKQAKGIEVDSIQEIIDTAKILALLETTPKGNRVAIVTHTLGIALIAAQTLEQNGIALPDPSPMIQEEVQSLLRMPVKIPIRNPVDLLAQGWADPTIFSRALDLVGRSDEYDAILIVFAPNYLEGIGGGVPIVSITNISQKIEKPIVAILSSPVTNKPPGFQELEDAGIPVFSDPQRAGSALSYILKK